MSVDYKATVFLPQTDFPMRGNLPEREPDLLARWKRIDLYARLRQEAKGREKFILHDGPPYANGHLHIGHALNKILKDVVTRTQQMMGKDSNYVPGWDCHGLPIEWKIEEKYRAEDRDKDAVPIVEFRKECREFAAHWIGVQRAEFERLGVVGDWDDPYTTMSFPGEAQIVRELGKFLMNGGLFKGLKPVLWSVVEKTALAEAEVEYHDHTSTTIWVRFPVVKAGAKALEGASVVIWTTTPWTMPGNRAVAFGPEVAYGVYEVAEAGGNDLAKAGERLILADDLAEQVAKDAKIELRRLGPAEGLAATVCRHPWRGKGYDFDVPLLPGDFVTTDQGTGFVHIAPGHGEDDFNLGGRFGIATPQTVSDDGTYYDHVPLFGGKHVFKVAPDVIAAMTEAGCLLAHGKLVHSYPHSWRSKAPLIFRATPQWFISMETNDLRKKALKAIDETRWVPAQGRNRIQSMIESRPDWCVSRQRAWGVPITVFVNKETGEPLRDQAVIDRVATAVEKEGAEAWWTHDPQEFLGSDHKAADYEQVFDILDVWFDSGSTHAFVLEQRPDLKWPASLYLEGSDQHRGWFHSSLLEACGTRGRAPYEAVLTHGFVLDEDGRKMSKSLGNVVSPQEVVGTLGADILRLWVVSSDYSDDLRIGPEILKRTADVYRRLRNTLRYLLGALDGYTEAERLPVEQMPELERWVLHRLAELDGVVRRASNDFVFHEMFTAIHNFCAVDLSAFYFDIRKDSLYCDRPDAPRRRATRTVMAELYSCLTAWLAPLICFTAEEAWLARNPGETETVHARLFPEIPTGWRDDVLAAKWDKVRDVRRVVTGALELARAEKKIGSSLQAAPMLYVESAVAQPLAGLDLAEIAITSGLTLVEGAAPAGAFTLGDVPGVGVVIEPASGQKCQRCWKVLPEVGTHDGFEGVCERCGDAVAAAVEAR